MSEEEQRAPLRRTAAVWGYLGLLPFYGSLMGVWLGQEGVGQTAWRVLIGYAAVILSFVGAVHWGLALNAPKHLRRLGPGALTWSVLPALIAAAVLIFDMGGGAAMLVLAAGFSGQFVADRRVQRTGLCPEWYLILRGRLTAGVLVALLLALLAAPRQLG